MALDRRGRRRCSRRLAVATAALGFYAGNVADYGATYGSLGAVIVLMLWFYVTSALLLVGAEMTAALARELSPSEIRKRGEERVFAEKVTETAEGATERVRGEVDRVT